MHHQEYRRSVLRMRVAFALTHEIANGVARYTKKFPPVGLPPLLLEQKSG